MELMLMANGGELRRYVLPNGETLIGRRPDCDLVLDAPSIAVRHARVFSVEGRAVLYGLAAETPVYVNGVTVNRHVLAHGDEIELAHYRLRYLDETTETVRTGDGTASPAGTISPPPAQPAGTEAEPDDPPGPAAGAADPPDVPDPSLFADPEMDTTNPEALWSVPAAEDEGLPEPRDPAPSPAIHPPASMEAAELAAGDEDAGDIRPTVSRERDDVPPLDNLDAPVAGSEEALPSADAPAPFSTEIETPFPWRSRAPDTPGPTPGESDLPLFNSDDTGVERAGDTDLPPFPEPLDPVPMDSGILGWPASSLATTGDDASDRPDDPSLTAAGEPEFIETRWRTDAAQITPPAPDHSDVPPMDDGGPAPAKRDEPQGIVPDPGDAAAPVNTAPEPGPPAHAPAGPEAPLPVNTWLWGYGDASRPEHDKAAPHTGHGERAGHANETAAVAEPGTHTDAIHLDILSGINQGRRIALTRNIVVLGFNQQRLVEMRRTSGNLWLRRLADDAEAQLNGEPITDESTTAEPGDILSVQRIEMRIHQGR